MLSRRRWSAADLRSMDEADLAELCRAWAEANHPHHCVRRFRLDFEGKVRIEICYRPVATEEVAERGPVLSECEQAIVDLLRGSTQRMTTSEILSAMDAAEVTVGESTVKIALAKLVRDKVISNCTDDLGRGYAIS